MPCRRGRYPESGKRIDSIYEVPIDKMLVYEIFEPVFGNILVDGGWERLAVQHAESSFLRVFAGGLREGSLCRAVRFE